MKIVETHGIAFEGWPYEENVPFADPDLLKVAELRKLLARLHAGSTFLRKVAPRELKELRKEHDEWYKVLRFHPPSRRKVREDLYGTRVRTNPLTRGRGRQQRCPFKTPKFVVEGGELESDPIEPFTDEEGETKPVSIMRG